LALQPGDLGIAGGDHVTFDEEADRGQRHPREPGEHHNAQ